jgi:hypothetical protein
MAALPIDLDRAARTPLATQIPYGGAWHTWNQGMKIWEVMKKIAAPVPERRCTSSGGMVDQPGLGGGSTGDCGGRGKHFDAHTRNLRSYLS